MLGFNYQVQRSSELLARKLSVSNLAVLVPDKSHYDGNETLVWVSSNEAAEAMAL